MNVLHICQNYNTNLYSKLFSEVAELKKVNQVVFYPFISKYSYHKSSKFKVHAKKSVPFYFRHFFLLRAVLNYINLRRSVNLDTIDVIHCHTLFNDGVVGLLATLFSKRKLIISVRYSDVQIKKIKFWLWPFVYLLKLKASKWIFISIQIKNYFSQLDGVVIGNGISKSFFTTPKNSLKRKKPQLRLLYVGRIIKRKNINVIIDFVSHKNHSLFVVGEAFPKTAWGSSQIKKLKAHQNISYEPHLETQQIIEVMDKSDVFVMASVRETFGIVYIEAMSRGLPIIYTKGTSVDGMFSREVGIGLKSISPKSIEEAINNIVSNYNYYHKNAIREAQSYRWNNIAEQIIACYD